MRPAEKKISLLSIDELKDMALKLDIKSPHRDKERLVKQVYKRYCELKKYFSYTFVKQLGKEGKDGRTFLAKDESGKEVAIKVFKKKKKETSIIREAKLQKQASQSGITPRVIEFDAEGRFIVMEKLDKNLFDYFKEQKGQLTLAQQKAIIRLLKKLDKCNIFHGDPNPLNFMEREGRWYIIDFGFAKPINEKTIEKYGKTPNMTLMPKGFRDKLRGVYNGCTLEYIEKYC